MQPRKTYNTLVGQLFNVLPIKTDDTIDSTMRRKIQKLHEYLQANPAKVPKVCWTAVCAVCVGACVTTHSASDANRQQRELCADRHASHLACRVRCCCCSAWVCVQASRRLMRRIKATLRKPGDNLGHVKIAVHTYAYLLARSADESSSYGPSFFLKELLMGQDAVVRRARSEHACIKSCSVTV